MLAWFNEEYMYTIWWAPMGSRFWPSLEVSTQKLASNQARHVCKTRLFLDAVNRCTAIFLQTGRASNSPKPFNIATCSSVWESNLCVLFVTNQIIPEKILTTLCGVPDRASVIIIGNLSIFIYFIVHVFCYCLCVKVSIKITINLKPICLFVFEVMSGG